MSRALLLSSMHEPVMETNESAPQDSALLRSLRATRARFGTALKPRAENGVDRVMEYVRSRRMRRPHQSGR